MSSDSSLEWDAYLQDLDPVQVDAIKRACELLIQSCPGLSLRLPSGGSKAGLATLALPGHDFVFGLGPLAQGKTTIHLFPYYMSKELQLKHGAQLKKLLSGKSCLKFKRYEELPEGVLADIAQSAPAIMDAFRESRAAKK